MDRRKFVTSSVMGASSLMFAGHSLWAAATDSPTDSRIEVLLDEPLGTIAPEIYGHFTEHLGRVIYDGIWVGPNSPIANVDGVRKELLDHLRKIKASVIRYPGGCFADSYDWQDGIGPASKRPRRSNLWGGTETNQFGTNEFLHFCKLVGSQPYLAANLRSLPARDFYRWVEYCNSPSDSTSLSQSRAAAGYPDPFQVRYWGVGNEAWGCGGNFTAQEYAVEFRRFTSWVPRYTPNNQDELALVASGPSDFNWDWTRGFLEEIVRKGPEQIKSIYGLAVHYYTWNLSRGATQDWDKGKGDALKFEPVDWYELLREGMVIDSIIEGHWQAAGEVDKEHKIKLVIDEWGPWYRPGSEATPGDVLEQTPTLRDAVFSAMTLDVFHQHPEKIAMANCAQLINCLNSLYLAHEDKFCITPVGHVFDIYSSHQGGQSLRTIFSAPQVHYDRDGKPASLWGLRGSASLKGKALTLTVVNPHVSDSRETEISIRGASIQSGSVTVLTNSDIHAHNSFAQRDVVRPQNQTLEIKGRRLQHTFPPASVTKIAVTLT